MKHSSRLRSGVAGESREPVRSSRRAARASYAAARRAYHDRAGPARCGAGGHVRGAAAMTTTVRSKQEDLERLGRALRTLSGSNHALLRAVDEASLLREICRVVVREA